MAAPSPPTSPVPTPPAKPTPTSGEEFIFRLLEEIATARTQDERAGRMQAFIQEAMGQLRGSCLKNEVDDLSLKNDIEVYLDGLELEIEKLFHPEESPWLERKMRMDDGVAPAEQWQDSYRLQCARMAPRVQRLVGYLYGAGILQQRRDTIARLIEQRQRTKRR